VTSGDLLDLFRTEMADTKTPYLWSDDFVFGAIDEAQTWFARLTDGIADSSTSAVIDFAILTGADSYPLHPAVKKIRAARFALTGKPVAIINEEDMPTKGMYFNSVPGNVQALVTGMDENAVRVWPLPITDVAVKLSVFRLPLVRITDDQALEIGQQHHRSLLLWVKHLAYSVHDAEQFDRTKAADFESEFRSYCAGVATEQARLRHKPRTVAYGGI